MSLRSYTSRRLFDENWKAKRARWLTFDITERFEVRLVNFRIFRIFNEHTLRKVEFSMEEDASVQVFLI